jgi:hypothetical protein
MSPRASRAIFSTVARVSGLDRLRFEEGEDRDALERVGVAQRLAPHFQEPPARRGERPLPAGVALHLDPVADDRGGQPPARFLLVQVARIDGEQVNLLPGRGQEDLRGGLGQPRALLDGDLRRGVADVVAEDLAHQTLEGRRVAPLGDRLHDFAVGGDPEGPATGTPSRRGRVLIG